MADVAAVLDASGVAGLHVGKKGGKGAAGLDSASFLSTFLSQVGAAAGTKGKATHAAGLLAGDAIPGKALADKASSTEGEDTEVSAQDGKAELIARLTLDKGGKDAAEAVGDAAPRTTSVAADAVAAAFAATDNLGNPALAATQAVVGAAQEKASATTTSDDSEQVDTILSKTDRRESGARTSGAVNRTGSTAIAADKAEDDGQNLPVPGMGKPEDTPPLQADAAMNDASSLSTQIGSSAKTSPATDTTVARVFDQSLRQVESRVNLALEAPVKSPAFAGELAEKVVWMAGRQGQVAELTLNPPHLGSVEVRLTVSGGEAGAQFYSANPAVRDAIEAAMPKLRELMAQAGLNLGDANVRDQTFNQSQSQGEGRTGNPSSGLPSQADGMLSVASGGASRSVGIGLVDLYA